jgi:hypothetical protein
VVRGVGLGRHAIKAIEAEIDVNRLGIAVEALQVGELRPDAAIGQDAPAPALSPMRPARLGRASSYGRSSLGCSGGSANETITQAPGPRLWRLPRTSLPGP